MKFKKLFLNSAILLVILVLLSCSCLSYFATEIDITSGESTSEPENYGWIPDNYERLGITSNGNSLGLPEKYDPRNDGFMTPTKDQGDTNLCWLYATAGAVENYVSLKYGSKFDISEAHGAVASSNSIRPANSSSNGFYLNNADNGGNNAKALQYFTNWNTPIFNESVCHWNSTIAESEYPITKITDPSITLTDNDFCDSKPLFNVTDAVYVNNYDTIAIKNTIMQYGGVCTGVVAVSNYGTDLNGEKNLFNSSNTNPPGHAVVIVGWDDNYSKDNFSGNNKPTTDGAWLVRNSYDDKNYFWLSYKEGSLRHINNNMLAITGVQKATENEYMLSYDYSIPAYNTDNSYYFKDDVYLCNVFDISDYTTTYNKISKVMFYLRATSCTYEVKVMQLNSNGSLPTNINNYSTLASGSFMGEGYITAKLNTPYYFNSNNKCAVVIKISPVSSSSRIYIPHEGKYTVNWGQTLIIPEINQGESYFCTDTSNNSLIWNDCYINNDYCDSGNKGNLIIRPILEKNRVTAENVTISPTEITETDSDLSIDIDADINLFNIHTSQNYILRQDYDYVRTADGVTLKTDFLELLGEDYTELIFEFSNDTTKTVVINPRSEITEVTIAGKPIIGDTLYATCVGEPEKDMYDVNYQWQSSPNGANWYDIANANQSSYVITDNEINRFIRVKVTATQFGNVIYPSEKISSSTEYKAVLLGDVDLDGEVTIQDSTLVSKYLVELVTLDGRQLLAADANRDNIINVKDVQVIQEIAMGL